MGASRLPSGVYARATRPAKAAEASSFDQVRYEADSVPPELGIS